MKIIVRLLLCEMTKATVLFLSVGLIALMISACDSYRSFDSNLWKQKKTDWWMDDVREKMVNDLIESDTLIGMNKTQVVGLLDNQNLKMKTRYNI